MKEDDDVAERFVKNDSMYSLSTFEHKLVMYVTSDDKQVFSKAFDLSTVPVVSHEQALAEERTKKLTTATPTLKAPSTAPTKPAVNGSAEGLAASAASTQKYTEIFSRIPEIETFGPVLKSSRTIALTESETEYVVSVVKHIFKTNIVIQYDIKNTLPNTVLDDVTVVATPAEDEEPTLEEEFIIPAPRLVTNEPGIVYVAFKKLTGEPGFPITSFTNVLRFTTKELDPTSGEAEDDGYEDEYQVEDLDLTGSDYVTPAFAGSFDHVWEGTGANGEEVSETLQLANIKSLSGMGCLSSCRNEGITNLTLDAIEQLSSTLSLQPLEGTDVTLSTTTHTLKLYGKSVVGGRVAALIKMAFSAKSGVTVKVTVRAEEEGLAAAVVSSVA